MQIYEENNTKNKSNFVAPLDKLAQLDPCIPKNTTVNLRKRAKAKYFTNSYVVPLAQLESPLQKSYNNTIFGCSNSLVQTDKKITSHYCNNRWCIVCNRIRIAMLINGYRIPLQNLEDKYFVTLTIPNVHAENLRDTIKQMIKTFQTILRCLKKQKLYIVGLRKIECTYNAKRGDFHPHFHLIVSGKGIADKLVYEWLKRYTKADIKAQDCRPATPGSEMELFKYFSKVITDGSVYVNALDVIFNSMYGLRVYQPLGIKKVSEDVEELRAEVIEDLKKAEKVWTWVDNDWVDCETGECLTGYTPDKLMKTLVEKII